MPDTLRMTGGLVDVALAQTHTAGLTYATVPLPWVNDWLEWIGEHDGASFKWWEACGLPGWDFRQAEPDGDGNVWLCLLDRHHAAAHGWAHVR